MDERSNVTLAAFLAAVRCKQEGPMLLHLDGQDRATVARAVADVSTEHHVTVTEFATNLRRGQHPDRCLVFESN